MSQLPNFTDRLDQQAFALALEAVVGTALQGNNTDLKDQKPAHDWIVAALNGKDPTNAVQARAMHFVARILNGPKSV
ncbi:MAG: hypothetical protein KGM97_08960 [Alphaproteobacteria bacterium]|nr:hypothetical protein [Alphaproteobacteria bacterium]MDE2631105.1 hypothetical protein [Alphaproteobacteria bacterium]